MALPHEAGRGQAEDGVIFLVLLLTLAFLMFMMSVPIWFSTFVRSIAG